MSKQSANNDNDSSSSALGRWAKILGIGALSVVSAGVTAFLYGQKDKEAMEEFSAQATEFSAAAEEILKSNEELAEATNKRMQERAAAVDQKMQERAAAVDQKMHQVEVDQRGIEADQHFAKQTQEAHHEAIEFNTNNIGEARRNLQHAIEETERVSDLKDAAIGKSFRELDGRVTKGKERAAELERLFALRQADVDYKKKYMNDYTLTRKRTPQNEETITLFNVNGQPIQVVDVTWHQNGDFTLTNRVWNDKDVSPADGQPDFVEEKGGLYKGPRAVQHRQELEGIIIALAEISAKNDKKLFESALEKFKKIGEAPSYPPLDKRLWPFLEIVRKAGHFGSYYDENEVIIDSPHFGGASDVRISKRPRSAGVTEKYTIFRGDNLEKLWYILEIESMGLDRGNVILKDFSRLGGGTPQNLEMSRHYLDEILAALTKGNQSGRKAALQVIAEREKRDRAAHYRQAETRGIYGTSIGDFMSGRVCFGGDERAYVLEAFHDEEDFEEGRESTSQRNEGIHAGAKFRLGKASGKAAEDIRTVGRVDVYAERDTSTTDIVAAAPETSLSGDGRFLTTEEDLGGTRERTTEHSSIGSRAEKQNGTLFRCALYRIHDVEDWESQFRVSIEDLLGTLPDIVQDIDVNGESVTSMVGIEAMYGFNLAGESNENAYILIPALSYKFGDVKVNDGANPETETELSEFGVGLAYRYKSTTNDKGFILGLRWTSAKSAGESYDGGDVSLSIPFEAGNYVTMVPVLGASLSHDPSNGAVQPEEVLGRAGFYLAIGGQGSTEVENVDLLGDYQLENMLQDWSGQLSPGAERNENFWRHYNLLQAIDANIFIFLKGNQMYGNDGELTACGEAGLAVMRPTKGGGKFLIDGFYRDKGAEMSYGGAIGYLGSRGLIMVGGRHTDDNEGDNIDTVEITAGIRF